MKVVVDTNIVFSAMWNTNGRIANILARKTHLDLFAPAYLLLELDHHKEKIASKLKITLAQLIELQHIITRRITFKDERQISQENWVKAEKITAHVDADDIAFVALALALNCPLWTGDKKLAKSLDDIEVLQTPQIEDLLIQ